MKPESPLSQTRNKSFLDSGGGKAGDLFRSIDWSKHPMNSVSKWSTELKVSLNIIFNAQNPMAIMWGPDFYFFYNESFLPSLAHKHPKAMGQKAMEVWQEIWAQQSLEIKSVFNGGKSIWKKNEMVPILLDGKLQDLYWTYGYSPIIQEDGTIGGVFVNCSENTLDMMDSRIQKDANQELIDTLESMSDAFFSIDKDWKIIRVNANHEKATAKKREDQVGKSLLDLFFSDEIYKESKYWKAYHKAMEERVFVTFEDYYEPLKLWTEVRVYPKKEGGLAIFFTDISERKKIEFNLASEKQKLEMMIAESPAGVALLRGPNFVFEKINSEWKNLVKDRDYIGKTFNEVYPELRTTAFPDYLKEVYSTGKTISKDEAKVSVEAGSGKLEDRYYDFTYVRLQDGNKDPYGVFAHSQDVTDRVLSRKKLENAKEQIEIEAKRVEQERAKFAAAFQAVGDGIFIFDSLGNPVFMNNAAAKVFGSNSAEELMERVEYYFERLELRDLDDNFIPLTNWPIARALRGDSFKNWQLKAYRHDINLRAIWSVSAELAEQKGTDLRLGVVVLRDITLQKKAEDDLKKAKIDAETASQAKSAFLANMSHEIRTPLGAILGFTELMKDSGSAQDRNEFAGIIHRNGKSLTKIIDDILDLSKVEAGRLQLEKINFDVGMLTREVADLFIETAIKKGIYLHVELDSRVPHAIKSDPTRIRQILINLIGNAVKFTSEGSVTIRLEPVFDKDNLTHIRFLIQDTGLGLSKEQADKLFEPFSQADDSTTRKFGGSGLGLALSKRLAGALGGDVWVKESNIGVGSIFVATVSASKVQKEISPADPKKQDDKDKKDLSGLNILLVEDVVDNQILGSSLLKKLGAQVDIANNGLEGVNKALQKDFDMVLMDMQMPILDGYQATERLRKQGYKKPIIALTAHAMAEERKRTQLAGCDAHLTKPLDFEILKNTIKHYCQKV